MFAPILHNLEPTDKGFNEAQHYNYLIGNKAHYMKDATCLSMKIVAEIVWKADCLNALEKVRKVTHGRF